MDDSRHLTPIQVFYRDFSAGLYPSQRLGQAFFTHFHYRAFKNSSDLYYCQDDAKAKEMINQYAKDYQLDMVTP